MLSLIEQYITNLTLGLIDFISLLRITLTETGSGSKEQEHHAVLVIGVSLFHISCKMWFVDNKKTTMMSVLQYDEDRFETVTHEEYDKHEDERRRLDMGLRLPDYWHSFNLTWW